MGIWKEIKGILGLEDKSSATNKKMLVIDRDNNDELGYDNMPTMPNGVENDTLRHDGTSWAPNNILRIKTIGNVQATIGDGGLYGSEFTVVGERPTNSGSLGLVRFENTTGSRVLALVTAGDQNAQCFQILNNSTGQTVFKVNTNGEIHTLYNPRIEIPSCGANKVWTATDSYGSGDWKSLSEIPGLLPTGHDNQTLRYKDAFTIEATGLLRIKTGVNENAVEIDLSTTPRSTKSALFVNHASGGSGGTGIFSNADNIAIYGRITSSYRDISDGWQGGVVAQSIGTGVALQVVANNTGPFIEAWKYASGSWSKMFSVGNSGVVMSASLTASKPVRTNSNKELVSEEFDYCRWRGSNSSNPSSPVAGDVYWNTADSTLKMYNGSSWITIG